MDTGVMIAVQIIGLYICLGPFVFLGLYILFDHLAERGHEQAPSQTLLDEDPALWTPAHVHAFFQHKKTLASLTNAEECTNTSLGHATQDKHAPLST